MSRHTELLYHYYFIAFTSKNPIFIFVNYLLFWECSILRRHPTSLHHYYFVAVVFKKAFMSKYLTCVFCIARFKWSLHILYSYTILFQFILLKCLKSIVPQGFPELFFGFQIQIAPVTIYYYYIPYSSFSTPFLNHKWNA